MRELFRLMGDMIKRAFGPSFELPPHYTPEAGQDPETCWCLPTIIQVIGVDGEYIADLIAHNVPNPTIEQQANRTVKIFEMMDQIRRGA